MLKVCPLMIIGRDRSQIMDQVVPDSFDSKYQCFGEDCMIYRDGVCGLSFFPQTNHLKDKHECQLDVKY